MPRQHADVLQRVEGEEHLADVDHRPLRPEHRVGDREVRAAVEEEHAERGVELVDQRDHVVDLLAPRREREVAPYALAAREGLQGLAGLADLDVRLRQSHVGEAAVGGGDGLICRAGGEVAILVVQHLFGLHQVRQRRRHVADLVADRLGVPGGKAFIRRLARAFLHLHRFLQDVGAELGLLAEAEQPVEAHVQGRGDRRRSIGARQAVGLRREKLRQGGAVDADPHREGRAVDPRVRHGLAQPLAEALRRIAPVHARSPAAARCFEARGVKNHQTAHYSGFCDRAREFPRCFTGGRVAMWSVVAATAGSPWTTISTAPSHERISLPSGDVSRGRPGSWRRRSTAAGWR